MPENKYFKNKKLLIFSGLIALFLVLRLAVLFSSLDKIAEPEELYRGTIAREIIQGPLIPLWDYLDYKVEYYSGGVLTVGIMAVPFFLLFGQTYISLKLVGLSFALATFILWYLFLDKFFSRKTAIICTLLFIFCMPFYTETSLITWGEYPELNFFTILGIFIFYLIFFIKDNEQSDDISEFYKNKAGHFFILGIIAGIALWFVLTYLLSMLFLFLFWFIFDKKIFLRKVFYIFCFGFLLGFSPAIYYALFYKGEIFNINGTSLFTSILMSDLNNFLPKIFSLLFDHLPNSFLFGNIFNLDGRIFSYLYYLIFIIAFIYLLWLNKKHLLILFKSLIYPITLKEVKVMPYAVSKESLILSYPLLFFFVYVFTNFSVLPQPWEDPRVWPHYIGYRYMMPVIPFILVILGIFIAKIKNKKMAFNIFLFLVLSLGLIGNFSIISLKNFGKFFQDKGYSYNIIGDKIGLRVTHNLAKYIEPFDKLEHNLKVQFYEGLGAGIAWRLKNESINHIIKVIEAEIKPEYRPYIYRGWGTLYFPEEPEEAKRALYIANNISSECRPFFYEGFMRNMSYFDNIKKAVNFIDKIERTYQPYCYVGLGYAIGFEFKNDKAKQLELVNAIDKEYRELVSKGIFLGVKER